MLEVHLSQQAGPSQRAPGQLPSQPEVNPRGEVKSISIISETQVEGFKILGESEAGTSISAQIKPSADCTKPSADRTSSSADRNVSQYSIAEAKDLETGPNPNRTDPIQSAPNSKRPGKHQIQEPDLRYIAPVPYPERLVNYKADQGFKSFLHMLKQLHIPTPFTDAITQIPTYSKYLKSIISNKKPLEDLKTVKLTEHCSAVLRSEMPTKMDDPGKYTIPCTIGKTTINKALCDLGASVSLMPRTIYEKIGVGELKPTRMKLQFADASVCMPLGVVENVPVQVGNFFVPGDFVVMEMEEDKEVPIILGRSFLRTVGALMDVRDGKMTLRIGDEIIKFLIDPAIKSPIQVDTCCVINKIDQPIVSESLQGVSGELDAENRMSTDLIDSSADRTKVSADWTLPNRENNTPVPQQNLSATQTNLDPIRIQIDAIRTAPNQIRTTVKYAETKLKTEKTNVELKPLPDTLHDKFLGPNVALFVIDNSEIDPEQIKKLLIELRAHRKALNHSISKLMKYLQMLLSPDKGLFHVVTEYLCCAKNMCVKNRIPLKINGRHLRCYIADGRKKHIKASSAATDL